MRKCLDRIFRKVVAKLENKKIVDGIAQAAMPEMYANFQAIYFIRIQKQEAENSADSSLFSSGLSDPTPTETTPAIFKEEFMEPVVREY